jgi:hypothetical protein
MNNNTISSSYISISLYFNSNYYKIMHFVCLQQEEENIIKNFMLNIIYIYLYISSILIQMQLFKIEIYLLVWYNNNNRGTYSLQLCFILVVNIRLGLL